MTLPTFVAAGTIYRATGTGSPALPASIATDDILLLFIETGGGTGGADTTITNQNGGTWTELPNSPQSVGTTPDTDPYTKLKVFWSRYNGTQGAPALSDSGNHTTARILAFRGVKNTGDPWNVLSQGTEAVSDTSGSITGATTTIDDCLVVIAISGSGDPGANGTASHASWANADLANVTEQSDMGSTTGNGSTLGIATGEKATAGAYGATTVTLGTAGYKAFMTIALQPVNNPPTVALNTTDNTETTDTTPTLNFTGTDGDSDDVEYEVQIDTVNTFDTQDAVCDTYSSSNNDSAGALDITGAALGQSFTGNGEVLRKATMAISKHNSPTGNVYIKIYAHSGTFGTSSVPTGSPIATSDPIDASTLSASQTDVEFTFSGANQITLVNGTNYCIVVTFDGDATNSVYAYFDGSSPTHAGNKFYYFSGWNAQSTMDMSFTITTSGNPLLDKVSSSDSGFTDVTNGADTHPFASGDQVSYTVQAGDALTRGRYYYRVRAIDPSGSNTYGAWSSTRAFNIFNTDKELTFTQVSSVPSDVNHPYSETNLEVGIDQDYTDISTANDVRVSKVGAAALKPYFLLKQDIGTQGTFQIDVEGNVDVVAASDTISQNSKSQSANQSSVTSFSFSHTVNAGNNRVLVVFFEGGNSAPTVSSITFGGVALTKLRRHASSSTTVEVWYLINPSVSTANVVVNTSSAYCFATAITFNGVDQTTPFNVDTGGTQAGVGSGGTTLDISLTPTRDGAKLFLFAGADQGSWTPANGETEDFEGGPAFSDGAAEHYDQTTAAARTLKYANSYAFTVTAAYIAFALNPNLVAPSIKVDLWNFTTSAWDNKYNQTSPTANTDFSTSQQLTTTATDYCDSNGWVIMRFYADYVPTVNLSVDQMLVTALGGAIPHSVTKSLQYAVKKATAITKQLKYVLPPHAVNVAKSMKYTHKITPTIYIDQTQSAATGAVVLGGSSNIYCAQTFKPSASDRLVLAGVFLTKIGAPTDNVQAYIYDTDGSGVPQNQLYASDNVVAGADIAVWTSYTQVAFTFKNSQVWLDSSKTYAIVLKRSGAANGTNYFGVVDNNAGGYANGSEYVNTTGSAWGINTGYDWAFATYNFISTFQKLMQYYVAQKITKTLYYELSGTHVLIQKSLQYAVKKVNSITKNLQYTTKITHSAVTKSLQYAVKKGNSITKSLQYATKYSHSAVTKSLQYAVKAPHAAITKSLKYTTKTTHAAVTKSLQYAVDKTRSITKSLAYSVKKNYAITKGLIYDVKHAVAITKSLKYTVTITHASISKSLAYYVRKSIPITKSLKYTVKANQAITKSLHYVLDYATSLSLSKVLEYTTVNTQAKRVWLSGMDLPTFSVHIRSTTSNSLSAQLVSDYIKLTFTMAAAGNSYIYMDASNVSDYVIKSGDYLEYDVYYETAGNLKIGIDLTASDNSELRDSGAVDQNGISTHQGSGDISAYASGQWYHRKIPITTFNGGVSSIGKTISYFDFVCEYDAGGTIVGRIKNVMITNANHPNVGVEIVKALQYSIPPSFEHQVTKSLQYAVDKSHSITKSLQYAVKKASSITKSLKYTVTKPLAVTKSLKYTILTTHTAITKSLKYTVTKSLAVTKSLQYAVDKTRSITKSLKYTVLATHAAITKSLKYTIPTHTAITKSLIYKVRKTQTAITKSMQYIIHRSVAVTKSLKYTIPTHTSITKSLAYYIVKSPAITKSMQYIVKFSTTIQKALVYKTPKVTHTLTKSLTYAVVTTPAAISKSLAYAVAKTNAITKSVQYTLKRGVGITKSLKYTILKTPTALQKSVQYAVVKTHSVTKSLQYYIPPHAVTITKSLKYVITSPLYITKHLSYFIKIGIWINKYIKQNSMFSSKYEAQDTTFNEKYSAQDTTYSDKNTTKNTVWSDIESKRNTTWSDKF